MSGCVTSPAPSELKNKAESSTGFLAKAKVAMLELGCGGAAGSIGIFLGIPFDLVKVRMQSLPAKYTSMVQTIRVTVREDGVTGLYRGMMAPIFSQVFINAIVFASESGTIKYLEPHLQPGEVSKSRLNHFIAGAVGGAAQCLVLVPTDVVKVRMQIDAGRAAASAIASANRAASPEHQRQFSGSVDCAYKIFSREGFRGMYKGLFVTAMRELPSIGCYFTVYKLMRENMDGRLPGWPVVSTLIAGGLAGCASWSVVYPLDVIKTNIQVSQRFAKGQLTAPPGILETAQRLYGQGGPGAFFRGIAPTLLRAFPVNGITFLVYERLKREAGLI